MTKCCGHQKRVKIYMAKKVLIIEDDPFLSEIYVTKFEESGFEVFLAGDGFAGLQKAKDEKPDVLILDIVMPNIDGLGVLRLMKAEQETKDIPVIILSNLGEQEDVERGFELGALAYIIKAHYTPSEVVARVKNILTK